MEYIHDKGAFNRYIYKNCHCVNAGQSPEQRKYKYSLCRMLGLPVHRARRLRDWPPNKIARALGYQDFDGLMKYLEKLDQEYERANHGKQVSNKST